MQIIGLHSQRVCVYKVLSGAQKFEFKQITTLHLIHPRDSSINGSCAIFWEQLVHADGGQFAAP